MKYVNNHGLPDAFYRAVVADPYTKGRSDFSATGLQQPARATVLLERHGEGIEIDVSSRVDATIGQGVHSILERAARPEIDVTETRYYADFKVDGVTYVVSAQIDLYESDTKTLSDWKTTKTYAFHKKAGAKPEWEAQLNIGRYLMMSATNHEVATLRIIGILKDWERKRMLTEPGYPPFKVMTVKIPIWPEEKVVDYIEKRIRAVVAARLELPKCTGTETWGGNRCREWCDAASVCDQYQQAKKTGLIQGETA